MDDGAVRAAFGQGVEVFAGFLVVVECFVEVLAVGVLHHLGQHCLQRQLHITEQPQLQRAAVAQRFGAQVDLRDVTVFGVELAIREVGAEHQQGVAVHHRLVPRGEADQAGHAYVVGVVVFHMFLAAQGMHDGRVEAFGQGEDFAVGTGAAGTAEQRDFLAIIEK